MENAILISVAAARRAAQRVPAAMGKATTYRVYKRGAHQGYAIRVAGRTLNERAVALLTVA